MVDRYDERKEMIIDFHTHIFPDQIAKRAITSLAEQIDYLYDPVTYGSKGELLSKMDEWGIDVSVAMPVLTKISQFERTNEFAKSVTDGRIISFGGIHPQTDDYKRDIDCICSLGLKGIKLHPEYQSFDVYDKNMLKLYDYALSKGLMLMFHAGADPAYKAPFRSSPKAFRAVIDEMQGGIIIAAHLGGHAQWDDVEKYLAGTSIYLDTSMGTEYYKAEQFIRIVKSHGSERILFGSDSPWSNAKKEIENIRSMPLTEKEKTDILGASAQKLLGL